MPLEPESDLHWTAFLYVSGELTEDESSSFERLLDESQVARDAVVGAVELAGALAIVGEEHSRRRVLPGRWSARRVFVSAALLAAAACLVLAIGLSTRSISPVTPDASEVASAWSELRGGADADGIAFASGPHGPEAIDVASTSAREVEAGEIDKTSNDRAVPSWLLSATAAPGEASPREED